VDGGGERERVIRSLDSLLEEGRNVRQAIRENEALIRQAIKEMTKGTTVASTRRELDAGFGREHVKDALDALAAVRHELRLATILAGLEEGMTIGELGRSWGISRQLASRFTKEARGEG
jgi:hypothetical protein